MIFFELILLLIIILWGKRWVILCITSAVDTLISEFSAQNNMVTNVGDMMS